MLASAYAPAFAAPTPKAPAAVPGAHARHSTTKVSSQ